ncbi:hypothetical protein RJ640_029375 [Escallonia rubra]|uniref:Homeobox domain-containing protein n=1 Tax=Escallonia rubra TaxID=112253 RepID=A0AA88RQE4_9ASTE|nr:hypothetical protein RJ640_029375 [Escallonia rubra]
MELALSLGEAQKPLFSFLDKSPQQLMVHAGGSNKDLGFCMGLGGGRRSEKDHQSNEDERRSGSSSSDPPVQLDLLPFSPVPRGQPPAQPRFPWLAQNCKYPLLSTSFNSFCIRALIRLDFRGLFEGSQDMVTSEQGSFNGPAKGLEVHRKSLAAEETEDGAAAAAMSSSPNSTASSFQMDFAVYRSGRNKRDFEAGNNEVETERASSRNGSDEELENGLGGRKKLRLTKDQSAFLEESFKEHHTLNPKQKLALANQLNLRPRQVEVWFQNRRARTKLKQTEVDCEYLKRCCENLTEENRRLHKELQELRALKTSQPFYMQLPATTLTMCPSCERVATTTTATATATATMAAATAAASTTTTATTSTTLTLAKAGI